MLPTKILCYKQILICFHNYEQRIPISSHISVYPKKLKIIHHLLIICLFISTIVKETKIYNGRIEYISKGSKSLML